MSTSDRPGAHVPAWQPAPPPAIAQETWDEGHESGPPPAKLLNARVVWRAARRHWWQILILWAAGSAGSMALAYNKIKTSYEATALLAIKTSSRIFGTTDGSESFGR